MQDEFVEREYQKLKQAAREQNTSIQMNKSQLHSQLASDNAKGLPPISSIRDQHGSSNASRRAINNSHVPLLPSSEDSALDLMMLHDREAGDFNVNSSDQLTADAFMAANSTNVKRKPPKDPSSLSRLDKEEEEENFIDQVTEPMRAKTKNELLGSGLISSDVPVSSRSNNSFGKSGRSSSKGKQ